jgi:succinate-semialdehyde dehydrogenase / glutarate-semialdehyde dehydrogenase
MYQRFGLFAAGEWRQANSGAKAAVVGPVTGVPLGEAPVASVADTEAALHAAEVGLKAWRATPAFTRADALHAIADEMIRR